MRSKPIRFGATVFSYTEIGYLATQPKLVYHSREVLVFVSPLLPCFYSVYVHRFYYQVYGDVDGCSEEQETTGSSVSKKVLPGLNICWSANSSLRYSQLFVCSSTARKITKLQQATF